MPPTTAAKGKDFGKPKQNEDDFEIEMPNEGGGVIIDDDEYEARVTDFSAGTAKESGNKMWIVDVTIIKGPHAGVDFRSYLSHSPAAAWKLAEWLRALGFQQKTGETVRFGRSDVIGRRIIIATEVDEYNGQERSVVKKALPHPDGPFSNKGIGGKKAAPPVVEEEEEADEEEDEPEETPKELKARLAAEAAAKVKAAAKKAPAKKAKPEPEPEEDEEEDDDDLDDALDEQDDDEDLDDVDDDEFEDDDDDLADEDEEEEEPVKPAKKAPAKKAAPPAKKAR